MHVGSGEPRPAAVAVPVTKKKLAPQAGPGKNLVSPLGPLGRRGPLAAGVEDLWERPWNLRTGTHFLVYFVDFVEDLFDA